MLTSDVIVAGGGISGLAFAYHAAADGHDVLVLEAGPRFGGCLHTRRLDSGFWFEMGAHTSYNSYGALLEIVEGCGLRDRILPRGEARKRFGLLRNGRLTMMGPLSVFLQFDLLELLLSAPRGFFREKDGRSTADFYSAIVGKRNYENVLSPFLAAVPSQSADGFPASGPGSLFKSRPRRKDVAKSFTFEQGLSTLVDALVARPRIRASTGAPVRAVRSAGGGFDVALEDGTRLTARTAALAVPPSTAAALVRDDFSRLAGSLLQIRTVTAESMGVVVEREKVLLPEMAFLVPVGDIFHSFVTRDPVPHGRFRGFAFHFQPGHGSEEKLSRIEEVLGVARDTFHEVAETRTVLPSPTVGHGSLVQEIDHALAGGRLAVTGNYFDGLAIEDCVLRSRSEWRRVAALG